MTNNLQVLSEQTKKLIELALLEDIGVGDITSEAIIPADAYGEFAFVAREEMVLCGVEIVQFIFSSTQETQFELQRFDSDKLKKGDIISIARGNIREILKLERVTLNFLQHFSGIATLTSKYVHAIAHTNAKIFDTRKTTPAFRDLEKYAVRCGGGQNHRMRLDDMVLIKDNHIAAAGGIAAAVEKAREFTKNRDPEFISGSGDKMLKQVQHDNNFKIMIEVDTLDQLNQAIAAQPDIIMLDNFSLENLRQAVKIVAERIPLEASGGVNLQTVRAIAETGVARISTSKITQSAPAVDIGLDEVKSEAS